MKEKSKKNLVIFASGEGSNAQKIIEHFRQTTKAKITLIVCNNPTAGVLKIAEKENIPVLLIEKNKFRETGYLPEIKTAHPGLIILAGFLWKIPQPLVDAFPNKIINIHPALLPAYGGKGMYGNAVHTAVVANKEKQSGITIHFVDEKYDHGQIILQEKCLLDENETPETLAAKIHLLEHRFFPKTIEKLLDQMPD